MAANALQMVSPNHKTPCSVLQSEPKLAALVDDTYVYAQRPITPDERAQLAALIPVYESALIPASRSEINRMIGKLSLGYPSAKVSDEEADARLELYADALADIPADILGRACMAAVQTRKFFPSVAELREDCTGLALRQWRLARIKYLIAKHDAEYREPEAHEPLTPEQQAELAKSLRKLGIDPSPTSPQDIAA